MERLNELTNEQYKYVIDLMVTLVIEELSKDEQMDTTLLLKEFIRSKTGNLLYDESSKLWWNGPSYIAEMYKQEKLY